MDPRLKDIAQNILDNLVAALPGVGVNVPDRRYIHCGQIVVDFAGAKCTDQLVVSFNGILQGGPNTDLAQTASIPGTVIRGAVPLITQYTIGFFRCVPVLKDQGRAPSKEELQTSGEEVLTDIGTVVSLIADLGLSGQLITGLGTCALVGFGSVLAYGPSGGAGGALYTLFVSLV